MSIIPKYIEKLYNLTRPASFSEIVILDTLHSSCPSYSSYGTQTGIDGTEKEVSYQDEQTHRYDQNIHVELFMQNDCMSLKQHQEPVAYPRGSGPLTFQNMILKICLKMLENSVFIKNVSQHLRELEGRGPKIFSGLESWRRLCQERLNGKDSNSKIPLGFLNEVKRLFSRSFLADNKCSSCIQMSLSKQIKQ